MMESKNLEFKGFTPLSHQRAVIKELINAKGKSKIVVVKSSRQKGKSVMVENILLYYALNYKCTSICLSPVLTQSRKIYDDIAHAVEGSGALKKTNAALLEMEFVNGSKIMFKAATQGDNLRGFTVDGILCIDEAAFIDDDVFFKVLPWVDVHKAPILMTSSPFMKSGFFFRYFNSPIAVAVDWCDPRFKTDIEKLLSPERLEQYRQLLPANQFRSEYLGEFLDDAGSVFIGFMDCLEFNEIKPTDRLYFGIDWANGNNGDDTVLTAVNQLGKQVLLKTYNGLQPSTQIDRISGVIKTYIKQVEVIQPELNSLGTPYTDMLKNKLSEISSKIQGFVTTNQSKNTIIGQLQVAFQRKEIRILENEKQLKELGVYAMEVNPKTKTITFNAPNGLHDDICMALAFAYDAYYKSRKVGQYCITVI